MPSPSVPAPSARSKPSNGHDSLKLSKSPTQAKSKTAKSSGKVPKSKKALADPKSEGTVGDMKATNLVSKVEGCKKIKQKKSTGSATESDNARRIRVSITFKVAPGWRGTKSRDFPGRHFDSEARDLLQSWANEFRRGLTVVQPFQDADARTVRLPDSQAAKRRKPYMGVSLIHRADAFHWFRATQERLMDRFALKEGTVDQSPVSLGIKGFFPNVYTSGDSIDSPPKPNMPKDVQDNLAGAPLLLRKQWPSTMHMRMGEFIEVEWDEAAKKVFAMEDKNDHRFRVYVKFGILSIPVNIMEGGRGSFVRASNIPPGEYNVNGAKITILEPIVATKKSKRKRQQAQTPPEGHTAKSSKMSSSAEINGLKFMIGSENSLSHSEAKESREANGLDLVMMGTQAPGQPHSSRIGGFSASHPAQQRAGVFSGGSNYQVPHQTSYLPNHHNAGMQQYQPHLLSQTTGAYFMGQPQAFVGQQPQYQVPSGGGYQAGWNPYLSRIGITLYEITLISKMRGILAPILNSLPYCNWPEVNGDVALVRFLRAWNHDCDVACQQYKEYIHARQQFGFDKVRERVYASLAKYAPTPHSSTSPWTHFTQDMIVHGNSLREEITLVPVADVTAGGDPVQLVVIHNFANLILRTEFTEFLTELIVRRSIAADIMTAQQGRIVDFVILIDGFWNNSWRVFVAGSRFTQKLSRFSELFKHIPRYVSEIYMINVSWAVRSFTGLLTSRLGFGRFSQDSINKKTKTYFANITRSHCDANNDYGHPGGGRLDPSAMARVAGLVLDLKDQYKAMMVSKNRARVEMFKSNNDTMRVPVENAFITTEQGEPRQGILVLHPGVCEREFSIEFISSHMDKIGWSFSVAGEMMVDFEVSLVLPEDNTHKHSKSTSEDQNDALFGIAPRFVQQPYIENRRLSCDSGVIDFKDSVNIDHAYVVFKFSIKNTTVSALDKSVENTSSQPIYNIHYNFWTNSVNQEMSSRRYFSRATPNSNVLTARESRSL